jgi:putative ABC transport system ATP-binding protein
MLKPQKGCITIKGTDLTGLTGPSLDRFRGRHIGLVFQKAHFVASLSLRDNLLLASWLARGEKDKTRAEALLKRLGIIDLKDQRPDKLSMGQQQRASIARALMNEPAVVLADEPTSNLDDANTLLVADLLREQATETGAALLIVTHDQRLKTIFQHVVPLS